MKACVISAPMTGSGKTTITLGLLSALTARGLRVQPFKVGPDFIDTGLHQLAAGVPSHNLDGWMLSEETNRELFEAATAGSDIAIVEGVMGLFDGVEGASNAGSTAEMAKWLELPIVLVVDAYPLARSAAAIIHGFQTFDPDIQIAGVIFNRVAGEAHFRLLAEAVQGVSVLGWLPFDREIEIKERHLGLLTAGEGDTRRQVDRIKQFVASHLDLDRFIDDLPERSAAVASPARPSVLRSKSAIRVALAHDVAFSFYYQANRRALEQAGATILEFSPIHDSAMPDADFLYIGGGYPELYRRELEANRCMRDSIRNFIESGGRFYAECGGFMYLAREIDGAKMVGILPTQIRMTDRLVDFGYCDVTTRLPSILGPQGTRIRGHQFHYSICQPGPANPIYTVKQRYREYAEGWAIANGIASYIHLHFLSSPTIARTMLESVNS